MSAFSFKNVNHPLASVGAAVLTLPCPLRAVRCPSAASCFGASGVYNRHNSEHPFLGVGDAILRFPPSTPHLGFAAQVGWLHLRCNNVNHSVVSVLSVELRLSCTTNAKGRESIYPTC